nr:unnamed protein product [Callosobruchus analis]
MPGNHFSWPTAPERCLYKRYKDNPGKYSPVRDLPFHETHLPISLNYMADFFDSTHKITPMLPLDTTKRVNTIIHDDRLMSKLDRGMEMPKNRHQLPTLQNPPTKIRESVYNQLNKPPYKGTTTTNRSRKQ